MKKVAIVTGASSGLGKEFVKLLINDKNIDEIFGYIYPNIWEGHCQSMDYNIHG